MTKEGWKEYWFSSLLFLNETKQYSYSDIDDVICVSENLKNVQNEKPIEQFIYRNYREHNVFPNIGRILSYFCSVKEKKKMGHIPL